jgi:hypothetical protein
MQPENARIYIACWGLACAVAFVVAIVRGRKFAIARRGYFRSLIVPWKLTVFTIAASGMMVIAPKTGDPTWDWIDSGFMALFTYLTAPWTLGVLVRALRSRSLDLAEAYVAACTWLFSASWSYDLYIYLRDGFYPLSWSSNLLASSILYAAGGACFSLAHSDTRFRVTPAFLQPNWPEEIREATFRRVAPVALILIAAVSAMLAPFVFAALSE